MLYFSTPPNSLFAVIFGIDWDDSYSPEPIEIQAGQTVTWQYGDTISHTVTSGQDGDLDEGSLFDSDAIMPNQHYSITFNDRGEINYYCAYHHSLVGGGVKVGWFLNSLVVLKFIARNTTWVSHT